MQKLNLSKKDTHLARFYLAGAKYHLKKNNKSKTKEYLRLLEQIIGKEEFKSTVF